jgi:hypothetical protein
MDSPRVHRIVFEPTPTQKAFVLDRREAVLFCGAMRAGKTVGLCWSAYVYTRMNPGAPIIVIRDTWTNLQRTTLKTFFRIFPPGICGTWRAEAREFVWGMEGLEGTITFLGMDDSKDVGKLQSLEAGLILIDEAAPGIDQGGISEEVFDFAMGRISAPGMKWHQVKLAANPPDESHYLYTRFVDPGEPGWGYYKTDGRENEKNLPVGYYEALERRYRHRPDLLRRLVQGQFGFTQIGKAVTPEWNDAVHLVDHLRPMPGVPYHIGLDFWHNPAAVICQKTPLGKLHVLWCGVGEGLGIEEFVDETLRSVLIDQFDARRHRLIWVGDPTGSIPDQSSRKRSAALSVVQQLGGSYQAGPRDEYTRIESLRAVLRRHDLLKVDKHQARAIWHALRGGWHRRVIGNTVGGIVKDMHSHPADALAYLVARLYPLDRVSKMGYSGKNLVIPSAGVVSGVYVSGGPGGGPQTYPGMRIPKDARLLQL